MKEFPRKCTESGFSCILLLLVLWHLGKILCTEMMDWMLEGKMGKNRVNHQDRVVTEIFSGSDYWPLSLQQKYNMRTIGQMPSLVRKGTQRRRDGTSEMEHKDDYEFTRCYTRCSEWLEKSCSWESEWNPETLLKKSWETGAEAQTE